MAAKMQQEREAERAEREREKEEMTAKMQRFENGMNNKLLETIEGMNKRWEDRLHNGANSVQDDARQSVEGGEGETDEAGTSNDGQHRVNGQNPTIEQQSAPQFNLDWNSPNHSSQGRSSSRGRPNSRGRSSSRGTQRNEFWNSNHPQSQDGRSQNDQVSAVGQGNQFRPMGHHVVMSNSNNRQSALNAAGQLSTSQQTP